MSKLTSLGHLHSKRPSLKFLLEYSLDYDILEYVFWSPWRFLKEPSIISSVSEYSQTPEQLLDILLEKNLNAVNTKESEIHSNAWWTSKYVEHHNKNSGERAKRSEYDTL